VPSGPEEQHLLGQSGTANLHLRSSHGIPRAALSAAQAPSGARRPEFSSSVLPRGEAGCRQLHMSRNNHGFGGSSVPASHTASSAHDVLEIKIAVIHCLSFLVVVPS